MSYEVAVVVVEMGDMVWSRRPVVVPDCTVVVSMVDDRVYGDSKFENTAVDNWGWSYSTDPDVTPSFVPVGWYSLESGMVVP